MAGVGQMLTFGDIWESVGEEMVSDNRDMGGHWESQRATKGHIGSWGSWLGIGSYEGLYGVYIGSWWVILGL